MQRDDATLLDILQAARRAQEFAAGSTQDGFLEKLQVQASLLYQLVIIGAGVRRLSNEFREANGELPWREIAGMRDHLVLAYDAVDLEEVWNTIQVDLPKLIQWLQTHHPAEEPE